MAPFQGLNHFQTPNNKFLIKDGYDLKDIFDYSS